MGKTPGEIFAAKAHHSYFTLFAYFHLHHVIDKNSHVEALHANFYGKIKSRKVSLGKEDEKNSAELDRKRAAMRYFSREILKYCHRH